MFPYYPRWYVPVLPAVVRKDGMLGGMRDGMLDGKRDGMLGWRRDGVLYPARRSTGTAR